MKEDLKQISKGLVASIIFGILVLATTAATIMKISDFPKATTVAPTDKMLLALATTNKYVQFVDLASQLHYVLDGSGNVVSMTNIPLMSIISNLTVGGNIYANGQLWLGTSNTANRFEVAGSNGIPVFAIDANGVMYGNGISLSNIAGGYYYVTSSDPSLIITTNVTGTTNVYTLALRGWNLINTTTNGVAAYTNDQNELMLSNSGPNIAFAQTNWGINAYTQGNALYLSNAGPWYGSNISYTSDTWAGPTNSIKAWLYYRDYNSFTPAAMTSIVDVTTDRIYEPTIVLSNAASTNITLYLTASGLRFMGSSTNALVIPSGKMGSARILIRGGRWSNVTETAVSQ